MKNLILSKKKWSKMLISMFLWLLLFGVSFLLGDDDYSYLELAQRRYFLFPFCYLTALFGTLFVSEFSVAISQSKYIFQPLSYIGRNSLWLLFIHHLDYFIYPNIYMVSDNAYINALVRVITDVIILVIARQIRWLYLSLKQCYLST